LSRVEAELLRREAPPSYGQLIAQGLIPPVEDFPVCSPNQVRFQKTGRLIQFNNTKSHCFNFHVLCFVS